MITEDDFRPVFGDESGDALKRAKFYLTRQGVIWDKCTFAQTDKRTILISGPNEAGEVWDWADRP